MIWSCGTAFRSENEQAMKWSFRDLRVAAGWRKEPVVIFDIVRGGNLSADGLELDVPKLTIFRVRDYSQNSANLTARNIFRDYYGTAAAKENYCTLFEYAGAEGDCSWRKWRVRIDGIIPEILSKPGYDHSRLIVVPKAATGFPLGDVHLDIQNLPSLKAWPAVKVAGEAFTPVESVR
jgi:hypothetical protein